jgi:hypothetical protein
MGLNWPSFPLEPVEYPMTKKPNPNQAPMTKTQIPKGKRVTAHKIFFGIGHWCLGFDWDLAPWSLGFPSRRHTVTIISQP